MLPPTSRQAKLSGPSFDRPRLSGELPTSTDTSRVAGGGKNRRRPLATLVYAWLSHHAMPSAGEDKTYLLKVNYYGLNLEVSL